MRIHLIQIVASSVLRKRWHYIRENTEIFKKVTRRFMPEEHGENVTPGCVMYASCQQSLCIHLCTRRSAHSACFTRPFSTAHTAICAREEKASLDKMVPTWVSTVR